MVYLLARSRVDDFETWQSNFEQNDSYRTEHGQQGHQVFHSSDDPNEVVVLFEWDDHENARALFDSDEMRDRLADAGVQGQPEMTYLDEVR